MDRVFAYNLDSASSIVENFPRSYSYNVRCIPKQIQDRKRLADCFQVQCVKNKQDVRGCINKITIKLLGNKGLHGRDD